MRQLGFSIVDLRVHREYNAARDGDVIAGPAVLQQFSPAQLPKEHAIAGGFWPSVFRVRWVCAATIRTSGRKFWMPMRSPDSRLRVFSVQLLGGVSR